MWDVLRPAGVAAVACAAAGAIAFVAIVLRKARRKRVDRQRQIEAYSRTLRACELVMGWATADDPGAALMAYSDPDLLSVPELEAVKSLVLAEGSDGALRSFELFYREFGRFAANVHVLDEQRREGTDTLDYLERLAKNTAHMSAHLHDMRAIMKADTGVGVWQ